MAGFTHNQFCGNLALVYKFLHGIRARLALYQSVFVFKRSNQLFFKLRVFKNWGFRSILIDLAVLIVVSVVSLIDRSDLLVNCCFQKLGFSNFWGFFDSGWY